jgi:hypothetical protein
MTETHSGSCLCGTVSWSTTGGPSAVNHCHCEMCRRASGAPVVTWATFKCADVRFSREPMWRKSSEIAQRAFCSACGSALAWRGERNPDLIDLTVGTSDRPDALVPREHIWTENKISWLHIGNDLPRYRRERGT